MRSDQSLFFIFFVTFVTFLLPFNASLPLTQNNNLYGYSKPRENSLSHNDMNNFNRDYQSYGNIYDDDYNPAAASYQKKDSIYSGQSGNYNDEQYDNTYEQQHPETEETQNEKEDVKDNRRGGGVIEVSPMVVIVVVILIIIVLVAIGCGILMICKKDNPDTGVGYSVAVSNRLFKEGNLDSKDLPCLNCRLIEMGEMTCYQETCPQCGNVPPCRQKDIYPELPNPDRQVARHQKSPNQQRLLNTSTVVSHTRDGRAVTSPRGMTTRGGQYYDAQNSPMV